ncbi:TadE/TadG family type IV pilus assembly protein [Aureimonas sp. N4]|uniref:TadE/TadG family type IV pilus assembly protein n=1 Tax=Aureimonas sp. N4 TaxID=1638165 RepID=UPI000785C1CB|nr:TadE/TadG family type IV pilus assembly protein [Aureimonas sp. N4]
MGGTATDLLARFHRNRQGIAAVEFAVIVPVMLLLYIGASDVALAITAHRKLQSTANATADLIAQDSATTKADLTAELDIARALMQPLDAAKVKIVLSSILIDAKGKAVVDWSSAVNGAVARRKGTEFILPDSLANQPSRSFVVVEASYLYTPLGGFGFTHGIEMSKSAYFAPRNTSGNAGIQCSDCS